MIVMIKLIIFDYDGVIVDSFPEVHKIYMEMCKKLGKDCPSDLEGFKKVYGHNSSECYNQLGFSEEDVLNGNEFYKKAVGNSKPALFKGIGKVLEELSKDHKLIVVSSSYCEEVEGRLKGFNLLKYFLEVLGRESLKIKRFEKVEAIKDALKKYNCLSENVLFIGDRNVDFIEGTKAGLKNILLVDYGWGYDLKLIPEYKSKISVKQPKDLIEAVKKY